MKARLSMLVAIAVGLGTGLLLSAPLAALISTGFPEPGDGLPTPANPFAGWAEGAVQDLLVLGTDEGGGNTDVLTLVRVEAGVTRVTQIPRDSYLETERWGPIKINALYSLGGVEMVKRELSLRMGGPIRHHVVINLATLRQLADLVGGIEVTVPKRLYYVDNSQGLMIDLQPGRQLLKGRQLEGFLRFRHDEAGDIGRLERQQLALQALFQKLGQPESILRLPSVLLACGKQIHTDLGPMELGGLVTAIGSTRLETERLAGQPFERNGISYWLTAWPVPPEPGDASALSSESQSVAGRTGAASSPRYRYLF
jgi:LCP family protein required for cell wall assembly